MRVEKSEIAGKLRKLKNILNRRLDSAELNGVLFKDNCLYATNIEIGIKTTINSVNDNESFIIPKAAIDLIENLPEGMVEIISEDNKIKKITYVSKHQPVDQISERAACHQGKYDRLKLVSAFVSTFHQIRQSDKGNCRNDTKSGRCLSAGEHAPCDTGILRVCQVEETRYQFHMCILHR